MDTAALTDYEKERAENIRKNAELLAMLDVQGIHDDMGIPEPVAKGKKARSSTASGAKPVQSRAKKPKVEVDEAPVRRSSRRLAAGDPNEGADKKRKREETEERLAEMEAELEAANERARMAKKPRHEDLTLTELGDDLEELELVRLRTTLHDLTITAYAREIGTGTSSRDEEIKTDSKLEELREIATKAVVRSRAKVTSDRIYSIAYHPEKTKDIIFFGDKHGALGIWDPLTPDDETEDFDGDKTVLEGGRYWQLQLHWPATAKSSISCIKFNPIDSHSLISSAYDCTMRLTSFETGLSREVFKLDDVLISSFDQPPTGNELWISDNGGWITHLDLREDVRKGRTWNLSPGGRGAKIGCVSVNPVSTHFLVTASNDQTVKIWDARKLDGLPLTATPAPAKSSPRKVKTEADEEDTSPFMNETDWEAVEKVLSGKKGGSLLRAEHKHGAATLSATWDPHGRRIVSTCYDDHYRIWDVPPSSLVLDSPLAKFTPSKKVKHDSQTGRWLTPLRAQWMASPDVYPHFVLANMNRALDVVGCNGESIAKLANPNKVTAVQAVAAAHPSRIGRYATGNASGRCVLWAPED